MSTTPTADNSATAEPGDAIDVMKIAQDADNGIETPANNGTDANAEAAAQADGTAKPDASKKTDKPAEQGTEAKPGDDPEGKDGKPLSAFEKAKKEKERAERLLAGFQKEKDQLRAKDATRDAEIRALRAELETAKRNAPAKTGPARDKNGLTEKDYTDLAKKYEEEGNDAMAKAAKERAEELRAQAPQPDVEKPAGRPLDQPEFQAKWQRNIAALIEKDPSLADPANPVVRAVNGLLSDPEFGKFFSQDPDGIKAAHEVALLMRSANQVPEYKKQIEAKDAELKTAAAEIKRLNGLLQPQGSHPTKPAAGDKKVEDMSADEAAAHVRAIAEAADRGEI